MNVYDAYVLFDGKRSSKSAVVIPKANGNKYIAEFFESRDYNVMDVLLNLVRTHPVIRGMLAIKSDIDIPTFSVNEALSDLSELPFGKLIIRERPKPENVFQRLVWREMVCDHIPVGSLTLREQMRLRGYPDDVPFIERPIDEINPAFLRYIAMEVNVKNGWWKKIRLKFL